MLQRDRADHSVPLLAFRARAGRDSRVHFHTFSVLRVRSLFLCGLCGLCVKLLLRGQRVARRMFIHRRLLRIGTGLIQPSSAALERERRLRDIDRRGE